jgi:LysM repeat protein
MTLAKMYKVTFSAAGITPVAVSLGQQPVQVSGGYGGWTIVNRQRRVGLTVWEGKDPIRMIVPIVFDGVLAQESQEVPISRLSRMALPPTGGGEPPTVRVSGTGVPNPGPAVWVIESLQWGTDVLRDFAANGVHARLRQDCTVNLLEYRADDVAALKGLQPGSTRAKKTSKAAPAGWPKRYTVKTGDTIAFIAAKFYHDATKWKRIADANSIRDPSILKVGRVLRIPAP